MSVNEDTVFSVYINDDILNKIRLICEKFDLEVFGYLVGEVFKWKEKLYIIITEQVFIESGTESSPYTVAQIEGSAGKYEEKFQELKSEKNNENLRIVGWWHSHPDFGCFLSKTDVGTQRFFFPESYQVAMVVDPIRHEFDLFSLDSDSNNGYKLIDFAVISP